MTKSIWQKCEGEKHITSFTNTAWRLVETQYQNATRKLVDSLEEQAVLEEMIETSKPPLYADCLHLHPLLCTAFRYPPLKHGSRFGALFERSIWYGSIELNTCMAEKAFYQFNFLRASNADYGLIEIPLTAFTAIVKTDKGIELTQLPFNGYKKIISSPSSYAESQLLGAAMRSFKIEAFRYCSARDPNQGVNIGLLSPKAFKEAEPNPASFQSWQCISTQSKIDFVRTGANTAEHYSFILDAFLVNGVLPFPAS